MERVEVKVKKIIQEKLPVYYEPKKVIMVSALPITSSQKIDYKKLEKMAEEKDVVRNMKRKYYQHKEDSDAT